jgi:hypothetical protein
MLKSFIKNISKELYCEMTDRQDGVMQKIPFDATAPELGCCQL